MGFDLSEFRSFGISILWDSILCYFDLLGFRSYGIRSFKFDLMGFDLSRFDLMWCSPGFSFETRPMSLAVQALVTALLLGEKILIRSETYMSRVERFALRTLNAHCAKTTKASRIG